MRKRTVLIVVFIGALLLSPGFWKSCYGQLQYPLSLQSQQFNLPEAPVRSFSMPDVERLRREDAARQSNRFAAPIEVGLTLEEVGIWTEVPTPEKGRVWRLSLRVPKALGLLLVFREFSLPEGATLHVYSPDQQQLLGAYTAANGTPSGKFLVGLIEGDRMILELYEPSWARGQSRMHLSRLMAAYETDWEQGPDEIRAYQGQGIGDALPCHVNVNCPQGAPWQQHKRGIVRILRIFEQGAGWCTGSLINNTAEDATPYVLSAFHCQQFADPDFSLWRFDFNLAFPGCANDTTVPPYYSALGCEVVSGREASDFLLLRILPDLPLFFNVYFSGWNRDSSALPQEGTLLHHPQGDVMKYSYDQDELTVFKNSINWGNGVITPPYHHFRSLLEEGSIEPGSSGGPLYDEQGRIVGQLHGGNTSCTQYLTYSGRFAKSWADGNSSDARLREWLDPLNTGALQLEGMDTPDTLTVLEGYVRTIVDTLPIALVTVRLQGPGRQDSLVTGPDGYFSFANVPVGQGYQLSFYKNTKPDNGVSAIDLVIAQQHIIGIVPFQENWQFVAADANRNGSVSSIDLVETQKVILKKVDEFPNNNPSWRFAPEVLPVDQLPVRPIVLDIRGVKTGDQNQSADPGK